MHICVARVIRLSNIHRYKYIKNNAWVTVNNDILVTREVICQRFSLVTSWITIFWSRVRWFGNDFQEWRSHEWKSLANHLTSDQNIIIHGNECIILFLAHYFMSWAHSFAKSIVDRSFRHCRQGRFFSALALWRHHNWSVMSREREILAL